MLNQAVSPVDALWVLYQSQTKRNKRAFRSRIMAEGLEREKAEEMQVYEGTLSEEERHVVRTMAASIKNSVEEVKNALAAHTHVGRNAEDFLAELEQG